MQGRQGDVFVIDIFKNGFEVVDLTHTVSPGMPCYSGTEPPVFWDSCTLKSHGFREKRIKLYSHTGTHMDAPAHMLENGDTLENFEVGRFVGSGTVLDLTGLQGTEIQVEALEPFYGKIEGQDFVLLYTGWSRAWGRDSYYGDYPVLSMDAAQWLAGFEPKGIGVDVMSVDSMDSEAFPVHRVFMEQDIVVIENLTNMERLLGREFLLCCLPLKIAGGDGAPVRAVALLGPGGG